MKNDKSIQKILERKSLKEAMPALGTPVSVALAADGKIVAFEAEYVDVTVGYSGRIENYFVASYEPVGDEATEEKLVVMIVNADLVSSISWSPSDEPGRLSVVPNVEEEKPAWLQIAETRNVPDYDPSSESPTSHRFELGGVPDYEPDTENEIDYQECSSGDDRERVDKLRGVMDEAIAATPRAAIVSQLSTNPGIAALRDAARSVSWLTK